MHLDAADPSAIASFLEDRGWLPPGATLTAVERAGEGNMNLVLRLRHTGAEAGAGDTLILKQARPWVEKYPDISAPVARLAVETDFYRLTAALPTLASRMPALIAFDAETSTAIFEDLGEASDFMHLYAGGSSGACALNDGDRDALLAWLSTLHAMRVDVSAWPRMSNRAMRALNHAHIFVIPLAPDGPDVDGHCPGLGAIARELRGDGPLIARMAELGEIYLADGKALLHGDFYPGSWLATSAGMRIIDPEFAFLGPPEFDLGVLRAHLAFAGDREPDLTAYAEPPGFDRALARSFAGAEVLRRLFGVAQLPLEADLQTRRELTDMALAWLADRAPAS